MTPLASYPTTLETDLLPSIHRRHLSHLATLPGRTNHIHGTDEQYTPIHEIHIRTQSRNGDLRT